MLTDFATYLQEAYTAYVTSYKHKLTYLLRTIPNIKDQVQVVQHKLIPAIIGDHIINDAERVILLSNAPQARLGGLGLKIFAATTENEHKDST